MTRTDCGGLSARLFVLPLGGTAVRFVRDEPRWIELQVDSCGAGYLLLADAHFSGWSARVDGVEAEILRADYALRALQLKGGRHKVVFAYAPWSFRAGAAISLLTLLTAIAGWAWQRRRSAVRRA